MDGPDARLRLRVRRAYERGRVLAALPVLLCTVPLSLALTSGCGSSILGWVAALSLHPLAVAFLWKGEGLGQGVWPGLACGCCWVLLPLSCSAMGFCSTGNSLGFLGFCLLGGLLGGLCLVAYGARPKTPSSFLFSCFSLAFLTASLSCSVLGLAGIFGACLGSVFITAPAMLWSPARQA